MDIKLFIITILVTGCSVAPPVSPLPATHPANPQAIEAPANTFTIKEDPQDGTESQDANQENPIRSMHVDLKVRAELNSKHQETNQ